MVIGIKPSFVFGLVFFFLDAVHAHVGAPATVIDITKHGAKCNGKQDNAMSMIRAWNVACHSQGPTKLLIPPGEFMAGEVIFGGPCTASPLMIEIQGTLLSNTDLSVYTRGIWISIERVSCVEITGPGTLNGQGEASWKYQSNSENEPKLPVSLVFHAVTDSSITDVKLVNSKGFHMKILESTNMRVHNLHINAPCDSPNTDGIHVSRSKNVNITDTMIGTGDDCISIGEGTNNILVSGIRCGPGHGISIGSLGKRPGEECVERILIKNCTLFNTTNGARIKTYRESPPLTASNIIFEDLVLNNVKNPIIIDQNYHSKDRSGGSNVKIRDVHFRRIKGTSTSEVGVTFNCSNTAPCEGIELSDIHLSLTGPLIHQLGLVSRCINTKGVKFTGITVPPACSLL